jgi:hypothetical protein
MAIKPSRFWRVSPELGSHTEYGTRSRPYESRLRYTKCTGRIRESEMRGQARISVSWTLAPILVKDFEKDETPCKFPRRVLGPSRFESRSLFKTIRLSCIQQRECDRY